MLTVKSENCAEFALRYNDKITREIFLIARGSLEYILSVINRPNTEFVDFHIRTKDYAYFREVDINEAVSLCNLDHATFSRL